MPKRDEVSNPEEPSSDAPRDTEEPLPEVADDEDAASEADEARASWQNPYREVDWEEGPPRVSPPSEEPEPRRRPTLKGASPDEIAEAHAEMLAELTCEAHDFALDYFETARGIDDRVAGRARTLNTACKLSALAIQLIAAADRHRNQIKDN